MSASISNLADGQDMIWRMTWTVALSGIGGIRCVSAVKLLPLLTSPRRSYPPLGSKLGDNFERATAALISSGGADRP